MVRPGFGLSNVLHPADRARRPARSARAVRAHRPRPHDAAGRPGTPGGANRAVARLVRRRRRARGDDVSCSCWSTAIAGANSASSASARSRPPSGSTEPWYNYHVGTLVHASRALDVYTVAPTLFLSNDHTGHTELCSLFLDQRYRRGKNGALLAKSRLLFIAEFARALRRQGDRRIARTHRTPTARARSGKGSGAISSRWSTSAPTT